MLLLVIGVYLDYGGGIGIKAPCGGIAIAYAIVTAMSRELYPKFIGDVLYFLVLPWVLGALSSLPIRPVEGHGWATSMWAAISGGVVLLSAPLVSRIGALRVAGWLAIGGAVVSLAMIVAVLLHVAHVVDLSGATELAAELRIGFVGLDPRGGKVGDIALPCVSVWISFTLVLSLGIAMRLSLAMTVIILAGLIVQRALGMWIGAGVTIVWIGCESLRTSYRYHLPSKADFRRWRWIAVLVLAPLVGYLFQASLGERLHQVSSDDDTSTSIRAGHLLGYQSLVAEDPLALLVGKGPQFELQNPSLVDAVTLTEISSLNVAIWFGIPFLVGYWWRLLSAASDVWRRRNFTLASSVDLGLVAGSVGFWIAGNTNPQMTSPVAFLALVLLRVRAEELRASYPSR